MHSPQPPAGSRQLPMAWFVLHFLQVRRLAGPAALPAWYLPLRARLTLVATACLLAALPLAAMAIEEPAYEVERQLDGSAIEVRRYTPYVVAEVVVDGPAERAGNEAFPILAGYIFGKNRGARSFDMTAPVTQAAAPVKLEMTAPVTQAPAAGGFVVQFVLPRHVTLDTAPEPLDPRVRLREVPGARVGVIRYSGFWSQANYDAQLARLKAALQAAALAWQGEPVWSRYNPPLTPWFLRRNEIWLNLDEPAS